MSSYQKKVQLVKDDINNIVSFSRRIQKAMGLSDEDLSIAINNNMHWGIPGYVIRTGSSPGKNSLQKDILIVVSKGAPIHFFPLTSYIPGKTEDEIIKLIEDSKDFGLV